MKATAEIQVIPLGSGVSVRPQIIYVIEILKGYDFIIETHASGTNIEGQMGDILAALEKIHEVLHQKGNARIISYLKLETRTDKEPSLAAKQL